MVGPRQPVHLLGRKSDADGKDTARLAQPRQCAVVKAAAVTEPVAATIGARPLAVVRAMSTSRLRSVTVSDEGSAVVPLTRMPCDPSAIWRSTRWCGLSEVRGSCGNSAIRPPHRRC